MKRNLVLIICIMIMIIANATILSLLFSRAKQAEAPIERNSTELTVEASPAGNKEAIKTSADEEAEVVRVAEFEKEKEEDVPSFEIKEPVLSAKAACILQATGEHGYGPGAFIYEKNAGEQIPQASITKLMTACLVIENNMTDAVTTISKRAVSDKPNPINLRVGDQYSNLDLIYAMLLPSANNAANALAESVAGDIDSFVTMMNNKAADQGLDSTFFKNPHGLDQSGHYSTASDVAVLTAYAYQHPLISEIFEYSNATIYSLNSSSSVVLNSTTQILGYDERFKGGKTGTQPKAGYCFSGVYESEGNTFITVVLGCPDESSRWEDTKKLHRCIDSYLSISD